MASITWWEQAYPGSGSSKINVDVAADTLIKRCQDVGPFNPDHLRGRGAWWDRENKRAILNLGDILTDGLTQEDGSLWIDPPSYPGKYIYERTDAFCPPHPNPLTKAEANQLVHLCEKLSWENPLSSYLLAGWCVIAPICGALDWRPSAWLLGPSGCGQGLDHRAHRQAGRRRLGHSGGRRHRGRRPGANRAEERRASDHLR
ncbi:MAG: hypothetical protein HQL34_08645 [Alphaproteobacteria bacterium]|nr:hypothetical protein [Alphaproteobacteria bacterium]